jgi:hypothetical protein
MNRPIHTKKTACRACGGIRLSRFLELGPTPLANSFLRSPDEFAAEQRYPLDVYFCTECSLVQLLDVIDPEVLFRNYIYVTGTSDTIAAHNAAYARSVVSVLGLGANDLVVEIASNDGSLLGCFCDCGVRVLGVEPALNIAESARGRGIQTVTDFFNGETARQLRSSFGPARAVIGNNVLAHVDDTRDFLRGCRSLLAPGGLVIIEVPYIRDLLDRIEYDTIYHEHLCYFSITALMRLCDAVGLSIVRVEHYPVHGGSLRMYAASSDSARDHAPQVRALALEESSLGLDSLAPYERFAGQVRRNREQVRAFLQQAHAENRTVAGYGAPAKGNTLLNYCGIGPDLLPYTVDKSSLKVGLFTPGVHIPVLPVSTLVDEQPDYIFMLAWNFAAEIARQQAEYMRRGGRLVTPIPEPVVFSAEQCAASAA